MGELPRGGCSLRFAHGLQRTPPAGLFLKVTAPLLSAVAERSQGGCHRQRVQPSSTDRLQHRMTCTCCASRAHPRAWREVVRRARNRNRVANWWLAPWQDGKGGSGATLLFCA